MNRIRDIGESLGNAVLENVGRAVGRAQEETPLPVDLLESDDAYLAVFDVPGARSGDVQVQYHGGAVEVRVERFREFHEGFDMRYPGRGLSLDGRVELPADARVDASEATATLQANGTLHVRIPKAAHATAEEDWGAVDETEDESNGESDADDARSAGADVDESNDGTDADGDSGADDENSDD